MKPFPVLLHHIFGVSSHSGKLILLSAGSKGYKLSLFRRRARVAKATNPSVTSYNRVASRFTLSSQVAIFPGEFVSVALPGNLAIFGGSILTGKENNVDNR
ncbi:hypothetical protein C241_14998 [Bradyrhizobium lupini HPC(L)]|uniref:Uncharacterized protein n=1 Tax=Bradyrhizobium lupini HPC(L) TaxID=1229491 RepID=A0ABP2RQ08_RHILU|nr:hypothetical protein C241_14998 [Bradyrhizobium lupini HPC(L)]